MPIFGTTQLFKGTAATLKGWREYRRKTGRLPALSIFVHFLDAVILVGGIGYLIWYSVEKHWSKGLFFLILLPFFLVETFVSAWIERRARFRDLRVMRKNRHANRLK